MWVKVVGRYVKQEINKEQQWEHRAILEGEKDP